MRTMFDSTNPAAIPRNAQMVAGYTSGEWPTFDSLAVLFPHAVRVSIAVNAAHDADVLDVENGDATPAEAPPWAVRQRRRGGVPTVYCNLSTWQAVRAAFAATSTLEPLYWIAHYDSIPTVPIGTGMVAKQYQGGPRAPYDVSAVLDYWPGVDPPPSNKPAPPVPKPLPPKENDVTLLILRPPSTIPTGLPAGTSWPGDFMWDGTTLTHVEGPADGINNEGNFEAAGVPVVDVTWAQLVACGFEA